MRLHHLGVYKQMVGRPPRQPPGRKIDQFTHWEADRSKAHFAEIFDHLGSKNLPSVLTHHLKAGIARNVEASAFRRSDPSDATRLGLVEDCRSSQTPFLQPQ